MVQNVFPVHLVVEQIDIWYLGSKRVDMSEDQVGSNWDQTQYYPWGQVQAGQQPSETQGFGTYVLDGGSGLYYADQRYYNQSWGRFLTADPTQANVDLTNPISWNHYLYANGDPTNGTDPSGLEDWYDNGASCFAGGGSGEFDGFDGPGLYQSYDGFASLSVLPDGSSSSTQTYGGSYPGAVTTTLSFPGCSATEELCNGMPSGVNANANDPGANVFLGGMAIGTLGAVEGLLGSAVSAVGADTEIVSGASSAWDTTVLPQSGSMVNPATDITAAEAQETLLQNGFTVVKDAIGPNGPVTVLTNGQSIYVFYTATSTGETTLSVTTNAVITSKLRFGGMP